VIVDGARRFLADPELDRAYTPYGATFLTGERWEDEPLVPRGSDRQQTTNRDRRSPGSDVAAPNTDSKWG
jgi:hypothetical protein